MQGRWLRLTLFVAALGVGLGFVGVVLAIGHASWLDVPSGIAAREYVTVGRRVAETGEFAGLSVPDYLAFASAMPGEWAFANRTTQALSARDSRGQLQKVAVRDVSTNFFDVLGVKPALGRHFGQHRGVVVSHALWQRSYGAEDIIGLAFELTNELPRTIVGVAPADFADVFASDGKPAEVWTLNDGTGYAPNLGARLLPDNKLVFGTLHEMESTTSIDALTVDFARSVAIGPGKTMQLRVAMEDRWQGVPGIEARPDRRSETRKRLAWLAVAIVVMLLLVFLSLVDSLTAAQEARLREQIVRIAVGASPKHLFMEALVANALWLLPITFIAASTFSYVGSVLLSIEPFATHPGSIPTNSAVVGLGAGAGLLIATFVGALAWVVYSVSKISERLKPISLRSLSGHRLAQSALVCISTVSLLVVVSVGGRYIIESGRTLGFHQDVTVVFPLKRHGMMLTNTESELFGEALRAVPTVRAATRAEMVPLSSQPIVSSTRVRVMWPDALHRNLADVHVFRNAVDADYFETVGVDFLAGRSFGDSSSEVVVSLALARLLADVPTNVLGIPLGVEIDGQFAAFSADRPREQRDVYTVVGVVRDIPYLEYDSPPLPVVYQTGPHRDLYELHIVGFAGRESDLVDLVRQSFPAVESVDVFSIQSVFDLQFAQRRSVELVLAASAAFALLLAVAGLWASLNRSVVDERTSVGIHFALGATPVDATMRQLRVVLIDIFVAAMLVVGIHALVATAAPGAVTFELWLAVPALASIFLFCTVSIYAAMRALGDRPINELVEG